LKFEIGSLDLNERQKKAIDYIKKHGKITNREYQSICCNVSRKTLSRDLQELVEQDLIKPLGDKKGIYYLLK